MPPYFQDSRFLVDLYQNKELIKQRGLFLKKYSNRRYSIRDFIIKLLPELHQHKILDVGCGNGSFLKTLHAKYPNNLFCGLDIANNDDCAQLNFLDYRIYDGRVFPAYQNRFDFIFCLHTLYHVADFNIFFNQIKESLGDQGVFVVTTKSKQTMPAIEKIFKKVIRHNKLNSLGIGPERDEASFCLENGLAILNKHFPRHEYLIKQFVLRTQLMVDKKDDLLKYILSTARYNQVLQSLDRTAAAQYVNSWQRFIGADIFLDQYTEVIYLISKIRD